VAAGLRPRVVFTEVGQHEGREIHILAFRNGYRHLRQCVPQLAVILIRRVDSIRAHFCPPSNIVLNPICQSNQDVDLHRVSKSFQARIVSNEAYHLTGMASVV
jgi:hypothetical protein